MSEPQVGAVDEPVARPGFRTWASGTAVVLADVISAFGFVIGFNQLATQSPLDAVLPVALVSVGFFGLATTIAALAGLGRRAADPGALLAPPSLETGFAAFGLGIAAVAAVGWEWGTAAQGALVGALGLQLLLVAELGVVLTARAAPDRPHPVRLALVAAQAVLLVGFALFALADAGVAPFD